MKKQALGKGLDAILGGRPAPADQDRVGGDGAGGGGPLLVALEQVSAGRGQPRRRFDEEQLDGLAASIRECGILQPLLVTPRNGGYELIAGERRLRAAARAGLDRVPVIVRPEVRAGEDVELALIENVQRQDLTPIEAARGYRRLIEQHGYTQERVAARLGKSRAAVANTLRLLALPEPVQEAVDQGLLSEGHARALLALPTAAAQIKLAQRAVREGLSVRETEDLARSQAQARPAGTREGSGERAAQVTALRAVEERLIRALGTKVRIRGSQKGRIEISFHSQEELEHLVERLCG
ncbi:MAG: ParB/RepB/Spo0J family partition protein [Deltaproteobacteria bacterium]|nr:MAG: ParB/RepB/Spo0J family partition protein [Deltaproteobacteria bacterium]